MDIDKTDLIAAAKAIQEWQRTQGIPTARLIRAYPDLGSDKTYAKILRGDLAELDLEQQLANYRAVLAVIEATGAPAPEALMVEDLSAVLQIRRALLSAMRAMGNNRVVIIQGQSGVGKTTAITLATRRYGSRVICAEASDVWEDKPRALLGAIFRALGQTAVEPASSAQVRLERVQSLLCESRRCLVIDEAHHLGKKCLNTIKTLVNSTPGEFVLVAIPTLWQKLESDAYMEARQLSTNRLSERLSLALSLADIETYLRAALPAFPQEALRPAAKIIGDCTLRFGNMAFVRDVADTLRTTGLPEGDTTAIVKAVAEATQAVTRRR